MQAWGGDGRADGMWFEEVGLPSMSKTTSDSALLHPHCYYQHWKANKDWGWEILSLFSPNLVANQTPISSITPPPMLFLDPPHTPRPWRPGEDLAIQRVIRLLQAASSRLSAVTPGAPRCFLYAGIQVAESSSPPPSE